MTDTDYTADVAIVGAGPAGLTAAEALRDLGYTSVVFERRTEAGGQACSRVYRDGDRDVVYDVGSINPLITPALDRLIKKYDITYGRGHTAKNSRIVSVYSFNERRYYLDSTKPLLGFGLTDVPAVLMDATKLVRELVRVRALGEPGYSGREGVEGATDSFSSWWKSLDLGILDKSLGYMLSAVECGGSQPALHTLPAMRGMKNLLQLMGPPTRYIDGRYKPFTNGAQSLWTAVAAEHTVRYGSRIERIARDATGVTVVVDGEQSTFRKLVVAVPLPEIIDALDASAIEQELAGQVRYCPVYRGYLVARGMPTNRLIGFPDAFYESDTPFPLSTLVPEDTVQGDAFLYSFVLPASFVNTDYQSQAEELLRQHFGAEVLEWSSELAHWRTYAPHFSAEAAAAGAYTTLENEQGRHRTYYVGGLAGGDGHGNAAAYAHHTITTAFPKSARPAAPRRNTANGQLVTVGC